MGRMKNRYEFMAGVHIAGDLHLNHYYLMLDFYTNTDNKDDCTIGIDRMNYLLGEIVHNSIFISENDIEAIEKYTKADLSLLTVPGDLPLDDVVQAVIATKLNMILEETIVITGSEISSVLSGTITQTWDAEDNSDEIHEVVNDEDESKWWATASPRFASYPADTDVEDYEEDRPFLLTWEALDLHWAAERGEETGLEIAFMPEASITQKSDKLIKFSDYVVPKQR